MHQVKLLNEIVFVFILLFTLICLRLDGEVQAGKELAVRNSNWDKAFGCRPEHRSCTGNHPTPTCSILRQQDSKLVKADQSIMMGRLTKLGSNPPYTS